MRRLLSLLLFVSSLAWADTTSNLITNTPGVSGTGVWTGIGGYSQLGGTHPITLWGCCTSYSGSAPFYDTATWGGNGQSGQFIWSYGQATVQQIIAVNQALANVGAGVQISGYNWGYDVRNMNGNDGQSSYSDVLTATTFMTNSAGANILSDTRTYSGAMEWTRFTGTVSAAAPIDLANAGVLGISFSSRDAGFWAGYYGPQVRDVSLSLNYTAAPVDPCVADPQSSPTCAGYRTYYTMSDDGYARVDLPFAFPFYGQMFTTSYMYTNGVVGFLNNNWGFCCDGTDLNNQVFSANSPWNYAIYALNTDLYPGANSRFYTQKTDNNTGLKYTWENVTEIGTQNENTFHVQIKDSGFIGINYEKVNLNAYRQPLIGIAGNISQGQYLQQYYGTASNLTNVNLTTPQASGWKYEYTGTETTDVCAQNPLFSQSCPGYAEAYYNQQCSINPLYATTCPGYETAYYNQQCSLNPLYAVTCPGYEAAYLAQQCSINPLYSNACTGYQAASEACSANPLTANYCPGYQTATAECGINSLLYTYCPNYQTALAACSTDSQSNVLCPGYSTTTASTGSNTVTATTVSTTEPTVAVKDDGTVETAVAIVADSAVNSVLTKNTETTAAVAAAQEPVVVASASTTAAPTTTVSAPSATEQKATAAAVESVVAAVTTQETANADTETNTSETSGKSEEKTSSSDSKSDTKSKAAARREAVKKAATEKAKELANDMSRAATLEAQTASQATVLGLMNYTPGFDSYNNAIVPDVNARAMAKQYNKDNVDNRNVLRRLNGASDRLHQEMVDQQYQLRR